MFSKRKKVVFEKSFELDSRLIVLQKTRDPGRDEERTYLKLYENNQLISSTDIVFCNSLYIGSVTFEKRNQTSFFIRIYMDLQSSIPQPHWMIFANIIKNKINAFSLDHFLLPGVKGTYLDQVMTYKVFPSEVLIYLVDEPHPFLHNLNNLHELPYSLTPSKKVIRESSSHEPSFLIDLPDNAVVASHPKLTSPVFYQYKLPDLPLRPSQKFKIVAELMTWALFPAAINALCLSYLNNNEERLSELPVPLCVRNSYPSRGCNEIRTHFLYALSPQSPAKEILEHLLERLIYDLEKCISECVDESEQEYKNKLLTTTYQSSTQLTSVESKGTLTSAQSKGKPISATLFAQQVKESEMIFNLFDRLRLEDRLVSPSLTCRKH